MTQRKIDNWGICLDQRNAQTMIGFGPRCEGKTLCQPQPQRRIERHSENRRNQDRNRLGPREWTEQPSLLSVQSNNRKKGDGRDKKRKERRAAHLVQRRTNGALSAASRFKFEFLMNLL